MTEGAHSDSSMSWLKFFFVCFIMTMAIGLYAIFCYDANAPEKAPSGGGHGMILPQDGEYAPHVRIWPNA